MSHISFYSVKLITYVRCILNTQTCWCSVSFLEFKIPKITMMRSYKMWCMLYSLCFMCCTSTSWSWLMPSTIATPRRWSTGTSNQRTCYWGPTGSWRLQILAGLFIHLPPGMHINYQWSIMSVEPFSETMVLSSLERNTCNLLKFTSVSVLRSGIILIFFVPFLNLLV